MKIRIYFTLLFLLVALAGCDGGGGSAPDNFKANKAELGEDWSQFKHDASFNVWVFNEETRPAEHLTPDRARVFWNGDVSAEELNLIDAGLNEMLAACRQNTPNWTPPDIWTKGVYFQRVSDYKIIFVPSNYTLQEGEAAGCAGMITGAHGALTAAGTVGGLVDRVNDHTPGSKGGIYIIVPKQSAEQLARPACKSLLKNAVRYEGEHVWMTNFPAQFFAFANDGNTTIGHPYCRGMQPF